MSNSDQGRRPRTDAELIRDLASRIKALETSRSARVGSWTLNDRDGDLWATAPGRTPINISALAVPTDAVVNKTGLWRKTITVVGAPTGGSFVLYYNDNPATIPLNANATTLANAIIALSTDLNATNVLVSGTGGGPWTLVAPSGTLTADWSGLTGGSGVRIDIT